MTEQLGIDFFNPPPPPAWDGGSEFAALLASMRRLQDLVNGTNPPAETMRDVTARLDALTATLESWTCGEADRIAGRRSDLPGRGHSLLPPFEFDEQSPHAERGRVRFGRFYLGGNGAAHGGALPLFFDDILGRLANAGGRPIARTAFIHVNYRNITPIDRDLTFEATVDHMEGRKRFVSCRLFHLETLVADAEGLFVQLLPGQP